MKKEPTGQIRPSNPPPGCGAVARGPDGACVRIRQLISESEPWLASTSERLAQAPAREQMGLQVPVVYEPEVGLRLEP